MLRPPLLFNGFAKAIVCRDAQDLADLAGLDQLPDAHADGQVPGPQSFHQEEVVLLCGLDENARLRGVDCKRLLAEDMLLRVQRKHDILEVVRVRSGDVDDVDVRVGDEGLVGAIGGAWRGDARVGDELAGAVFGRGGRDGGDGVRDVACVARGRVDEEVFDKDCGGQKGSFPRLFRFIPWAILPVAGQVSDPSVSKLSAIHTHDAPANVIRCHFVQLYLYEEVYTTTKREEEEEG